MSESFSCAPGERDNFQRWLTRVREFLLAHNPVARSLKHMMDVHAGDPAGASPRARLEITVRDGPARDSPEIAAYYRSTETVLLPPARELVVYPYGEDPDDPGVTRTGVRYAGRRLISEKDSLYESLQYPLLFPRGQGGYFEKRTEVIDGARRVTSEVVSTTNNPLTLHAYVRRALYQAEALRLCGRLADEWVLDNYSRWQSAQFQYLKHQLYRPGGAAAARVGGRGRGRVSVTRSLANATVQSARGRVTGADEFQSVGRLLTMPASVPGSKGYQNRLLDDGMCVVDRLGKPTLFITMTCNSNWPEITSQLLPGQASAEASAITNRVFKMKLSNLIAKLRSGHYFGGRKAVFITSVVEFQKRGLPHAHIAFRFEGEQPTSSEAIDAIVSAELPVLTPDSTDEDKALHVIVSSCMIHSCREGRCFPQGSSIESRSCKYGYPFQHNDITHADERGYVQYRRRGSENANVVSFNRDMLLEFGTHINVQIAHTVNILSYLFKYFVKGVDMVRMAVPTLEVNGQQRHDEFEEFERARYLSASEASWRFLGYDVNKLEPAVTVYGVHAEGEDALLIGDGESLEEQADTQVSWLLRYFQRPLEDRFNDVRYLEYYETYNVKQNITGNPPQETRFRDVVASRPYHVWPRVGVHVCRMYKARPSEGRRYFIRKLLQWVPARSYDDLCTVDGVVLRTPEGPLDFQRACYLRGLIAQDGEYADAMREAVRLQHLPFHVRCLYADCIQDGANSLSLRDEFLGYMVHDFDGRLDACLRPGYEPTPLAKWKFYEHVSSILASNGRSMHQYGLPEMRDLEPPEELLVGDGDVLRAGYRGTNGSQPLMFEPDYAANALFHSDNVDSLTAEQGAVFQAVVAAVQNPDEPQRCFFVDGPGGTGKSFLMKVLAAWANSNPDTPCLCAAFQGIVAQMYLHGVTLHRAFCLPLDTEFGNGAAVTSTVQAGSAHGNRLASFKLFIIDEISMVHSTYFTLIDLCLRNVTRRDVPFGGAVVLCGGDLRQLSAVVPGGSHMDTVAASVISNPLWADFAPFRLTIPQRDRRDPEWSSAVMAIGSGTAQRYNSDKEPMETRHGTFSRAHYVAVPPRVTILHTADDAVRWLYEGVQPEGSDWTENNRSPASRRAMLCPLNATVDEFNGLILRSHYLTQGEPDDGRENPIVCLLASEMLEHNDDNPQQSWNRTHDVSEEFMAKLTNSGVPNHALELRVGCIVIVMRNLCAKYGIMNGVKLRVISISRFLVVARTLCSAQRTVLLPRISFSMTVPSSAVRVTRRQFPLRLAYALTINKSQGQTLARVCFDLRSPVFTHGAGYVGLGRVQGADDLAVLLGEDARGPDGRFYILNIVYAELVNAVFNTRGPRSLPRSTPFSMSSIPRVRVLASTPMAPVPTIEPREPMAYERVVSPASDLDDCQDTVTPPEVCSIGVQVGASIPESHCHCVQTVMSKACTCNLLQVPAMRQEYARSRSSPSYSWVYVPLIKAALGMDLDIGTYEEVCTALGGDSVASHLWHDLVTALQQDFQTRGVTEESIYWQTSGEYMDRTEQERLLFPAVFTANGDARPSVAGRLYQDFAYKLVTNHQLL